MSKHNIQVLSDLAHGVLGTTAPLLAVIASWQEHLEWGLRITSLVIGIAVGVFTIRSLLRRKR